MSTPRTDELYNSVCFFTDEEQAVDALADLRDLSRELERENGALKAKVEVIVKNYEDYKAENVALKQALDAQMQYQRELRADRDRLDWLGSHQGIIEHWEGDWYCAGKMFATFRAAIDAAMGEDKL